MNRTIAFALAALLLSATAACNRNGDASGGTNNTPAPRDATSGTTAATPAMARPADANATTGAGATSDADATARGH